MESLFYTISGLPIHALIVHFAVVILPIAAAALIAIIYSPKLKSKYSIITIFAIAVGAIATFIAKQSGEALAEHIGLPVKHSNYASILTIAAFFLTVGSWYWYRSSKGRRSRVVTPIGHGLVLLSVAVISLTFLTGHTGAEAVWKNRLASAAPAATPKATATATPKATATKKAQASYSLADIATHASSKSCWSAIDGNVYNLTKWINRHPGGSSVIKALCGKDGSSMFNGQHSGQRNPARELSAFKIGKLA